MQQTFVKKSIPKYARAKDAISYFQDKYKDDTAHHVVLSNAGTMAQRWIKESEGGLVYVGRKVNPKAKNVYWFWITKSDKKNIWIGVEN